MHPPYSYAGRIADARRRRADLLVVDRLDNETVPAALQAAQEGLWVLSQLETVFRGAGVARHLLDLGAKEDRLGSLAWVVSVQRMATLCAHCKQPVVPDSAQLARLKRHLAHLAGLPPTAGDEEGLLAGFSPEVDSAFHRAVGCDHCQRTGRQGDVMVFDLFRLHAGASPLQQSSILPMEAYVWQLATLGHLPLEDVLHFENDQFRRTYYLLNASERALVDANAALERKLAELEAAHRVLEQRTKALISLHEIGQALISSSDLDDLAARVCRRARDLCGADRAILYYSRPAGRAEVLAMVGWDPSLLHQQFDAGLVFDPATSQDLTPFNRWPPGIPPRHPDLEGAALRAGLSVPLLAQNELVGQMIVHSTQKPRFTPGEVALLRTFANQAALAIQRAGLIAQLRDKIAQLEAAQAELAKKERMERELELARQVQQSMMPRTFPSVTGYRFAARNEPARQVGGDFYDVILLDPEHIGLVIGDVSDKGMPAALYMALTRSLLLAEARKEYSPRNVMANINRLLLELGEPTMMVTVFYGVVECSTRRLSYTRAGHDRPLLLRDGQVHELGGKGIALGLLDSEELALSEEELALSPGDWLVLYTDGLTDALDPEGRLFDRDRLVSVLESCAGLPADQFCAAVFAGMAAYRGTAQQFDDMTMLVVEIE